MDSPNCKCNRCNSFAWWNHRSSLERFLSLISVFSLVLCIIIATALAILSSQMNSVNDQKLTSGKRSQEQELCLTSGCTKAAAKVLEYIDENIDPCNDFYSFACGGWLKNTMIPDDQSSTSAWTIFDKELQRRLRDTIENIQDTEPPYIQNLKNAYDACTNTTEIENQGSEPLKTVLRKLGGWPVVHESNIAADNFADALPTDEWPKNADGSPWWWGKGTNVNGFDYSGWIETLKLIRRMGLPHNIFATVLIMPDIRNNSRNIIELDQPYLGLDYSYLQQGLDEPEVSAYYQLMVKSAVELGAKQDVAKKEMRTVLEFEMKLANITVPREERRNVSESYNKMKCHELKNISSEIPWELYLNAMLDENIQLDEDIIVGVPTYIKEMGLLIKSTNEKIIQNYMLWKVTLGSMSSLDKKWRDIIREYTSVFTGKISERARWLQCLDVFSDKLSIAIGSLYARNYLHPDQRNQVSDIARYVSKAFLKNLENVDWMDETTKGKAKTKAESMIMFISYPDEVLNDSALATLYSNLHLQPMNHFENRMKLNKWYYEYAYSKLRKHNTRGDWENWAGIASVDAFYHPTENALEIPGGLLQDFFHSSEKPKYLNFGSLGCTIGHEITHGFDDEGRQFDHVGNNFNWWKEETDKNFKERAQCMIYQYGNYTHKEVGMNVNGINTLGENIADNGAFKEAYWAYKQWVNDNGEEPRLPSLRYTQTQLFWISAVMAECSKQRLEDLKVQIMLDSHSPAYNRVMGPLTNLKEFSEEFECPLGSPMNPEKKCVIW